MKQQEKLKVYGRNGEPLGAFLPDCAGFEITSMETQVPWEYIYQNRDMLLKVDQFGPVYAQAHPPGDVLLFQRENTQRVSNWNIWIQAGEEEPFNCFFYPVSGPNLLARPDKFRVTYRPECVSYELEYTGLQVTTEFFVPKHGCEVVLKSRVRNLRNEPVNLFCRPYLIPYVNQAQIAPWDKYEWYLKTGLGKAEQTCFWSQLMDSNADAAKRRTAVLWTNRDCCGAEISLERFVGRGSTERPQCALSGDYRLQNSGIPEERPGKYTKDNTVYGYSPVWAAEYDWELKPNEEKLLTQVLSMPPTSSNGWFVEEEELKKTLCYFNESNYEVKKKERKEQFTTLSQRNHIQTEDEMLNYYVNHWLPLQMDWVASLDRGWPTGMRGSRDSAQDFTALLTLNPEYCRSTLFAMLSCQRTDGWFPRQYSSMGRTGKHDLRGHVDGGVFFMEFLWSYLAYTGDFSLLEKTVPWLDKEEESTVLEHAIKTMDYYTSEENIGEHGLCKIWEGDWLDAVNRAGTKGRGESVLVTEQAVMGLWYLEDILRKLSQNADKMAACQEYANKFKDALLKNARNRKGWFNGTFTDRGEWIFSDCDPDGACRPYGPVNWYAVIAGIVQGKEAKQVMNVAEQLLGPYGYRLYYPPMGALQPEKLKKIQCVGRAASGDAPPFLGENGNVYNHGSQGFLIRARAAAGDGDGALEALKWLLPYDQQKHPTSTALGAPYAIVNCWQELPLFPGRALMSFLTGSVAMAQRGVWEWIVGLKPTLDGISVFPCLPKAWGNVRACAYYRGKRLTVSIKDGATKAFVNGYEIDARCQDPFTNRSGFWISDSLMTDDSVKLDFM